MERERMRLALCVVAAMAAMAAPHGTANADSREELVPVEQSIDEPTIQVTVLHIIRTGTPIPELTPTPTIEPTPTQVAWPAQLNAGQMTEVLMLAGWPEHLLGEASAIAWCESTHQPYVTGAVGEVGLFQIRPEFHAWRAEGDLYDPVVNAKAALHLYREQSWQPWSCRRVLY